MKYAAILRNARARLGGGSDGDGLPPPTSLGPNLRSSQERTGRPAPQWGSLRREICGGIGDLAGAKARALWGRREVVAFSSRVLLAPSPSLSLSPLLSLL
uniref:Uncharacterized protein n=1 Tax=Arundo donax TaxID=35708 RepID=A0A0A9P1H1_ARUDO